MKFSLYESQEPAASEHANNLIDLQRANQIHSSWTFLETDNLGRFLNLTRTLIR